MNPDEKRMKSDVVTAVPALTTPFDEYRDGDKELSEKVIGCAFKVSNTLGCGFLEKVYDNALAHEIRKSGLLVEQQKNLPVFYDGIQVGDYWADIVVEGRLIVELKAIEAISNIHMAQCLNYLKATNYKLSLLINFGTPKVQIKRISL